MKLPPQTGIWRHDYLLQPDIPTRFRLTLGEGRTEITALAVTRYRPLHLLREDHNPTGSHKDRAMAFLVSLAQREATPGFVISTSGNAGISLAQYARAGGRKAVVLMKPGRNRAARLVAAAAGCPIMCGKPINYANAARRWYGLTDMRTSRHPQASQGYKTIAMAICESGLTIDSLFMFSTSFATIMGIFEGYRYLHARFGLAVPRLYAVLGGDFHPFPVPPPGRRGNRHIQAWGRDGWHYIDSQGKAPAYDDALTIGGACSRERFMRICRLLHSTGGGAVYVRSTCCREQVDAALQHNRLAPSLQSRLALYAAQAFLHHGRVLRPLVVYSGSAPAGGAISSAGFHAGNLSDLRRILREYFAQ